MSTLFLTHSACLDHDTGAGHPERPDRLRAVERALEDEKFQTLAREQAPMAMKKRDDKVTDGGIAEDVLRNAPATDGQFFLVPKVVE
jgi:Asp-tRNA(Asn)/Glu-tRNA(Gln) amidotransferase C subunit